MLCIATSSFTSGVSFRYMSLYNPHVMTVQLPVQDFILIHYQFFPGGGNTYKLLGEGFILASIIKKNVVILMVLLKFEV